jgi:septal ring factor EnvC (AmiA/AmiB activator)
MAWNRHIYGPDGNAVCFMAHSDGKDVQRDRANAALIARAPDLAAEVERLREAYRKSCDERAALVDEVFAERRKAAEQGRNAVEIFDECKRLQAENAELRRKVEALEKDATRWQPIETAPQTGLKVILHYVNRNHKPRTVMARWLTDEQAAETDADDVGLEGGWYECIDNWDDYTESNVND